MRCAPRRGRPGSRESREPPHGLAVGEGGGGSAGTSTVMVDRATGASFARRRLRVGGGRRGRAGPARSRSRRRSPPTSQAKCRGGSRTQIDGPIVPRLRGERGEPGLPRCRRLRQKPDALSSPATVRPTHRARTSPGLPRSWRGIQHIHMSLKVRLSASVDADLVALAEAAVTAGRSGA